MPLKRVKATAMGGRLFRNSCFGGYLAMSRVIFCVFCVTLLSTEAWHLPEGGSTRGPPAEATVDELHAALEKWEGDVAFFFYTSWDTSSRHLLGLWDQALRFFSASGPNPEKTSSSRLLNIWRQFVPPLGSLQLRRFDCEKSEAARKLCRSLGLPFLPAVLFFSYAPLREESGKRGTWSFFDADADKSLPPRSARFKGDLFMYDALLDWLQMMRRISYVQQLLERKGPETGEKVCAVGSQSATEKELADCRKRLTELEAENEALRQETRLFHRRERDTEKPQ
ncbi:putative transmembrane protein [Toxoplasma gondii RUB]|uniref:Transmembrane protein n=5 Tax=Toxoplasma gondii TaxID=5811 RepID=V4ZGJ6_TOXGV|nr:putative transmembrane protein [Toxoplasma gondii VEG]KFG61995.1 putative transmembrane protein [Toxoplasma gondii RUB]KFH11722.1 putative transmembrane protein [Toxoplasma gondii MAS]